MFESMMDRQPEPSLADRGYYRRDHESERVYAEAWAAQYGGRTEQVCERCGTDCHDLGFYCEPCNTLICERCTCH